MSKKVAQPPAPSHGQGINSQQLEQPEKFLGQSHLISRQMIKVLLEKWDFALRIKEAQKIIPDYAIQQIVSACHVTIPYLLSAPDDKSPIVTEDQQPPILRIDAWAGGSQIGYQKRMTSQSIQERTSPTVQTMKTKSQVSGGESRLSDFKRGGARGASTISSGTGGAFYGVKKKLEDQEVRVVHLDVEEKLNQDGITQAELDRMRFRVKRKKQEMEDMKAEMEKEKRQAEKGKEKEKELLHTFDHNGKMILIRSIHPGKGTNLKLANYQVSAEDEQSKKPSQQKSSKGKSSKKNQTPVSPNPESLNQDQSQQPIQTQESQKQPPARRGGKGGQANKPALSNPLLPPPPLISDQNSFMKTIKDSIKPIMGVMYKEKEYQVSGQTYKQDPQRTKMTKQEYYLTAAQNTTGQNFPGKKPGKRASKNLQDGADLSLTSPISDSKKVSRMEVSKVEPSNSMDILMLTNNMSDQALTTGHERNVSILPQIPDHMKGNQLAPTIMNKRGVKIFSKLPGLGNPNRKIGPKVPQHIVSQHPLLSPRLNQQGHGVSHVINYRQARNQALTSSYEHSNNNTLSLHDQFNQQILFSSDWGNQTVVGDTLSPKSAAVKRMERKSSYQAHPLSVRAKDIKQIMKGHQIGRANKLPPPPLGKSYGHGIMSNASRLLGRNLVDELDMSTHIHNNSIGTKGQASVDKSMVMTPK